MAEFDEDKFNESMDIHEATQRYNHAEDSFDDAKFDEALKNAKPSLSSMFKGKYQPQLGRKPVGDLPPVSVGESAARGGFQGLTLDAGDELKGAANFTFSPTPKLENYTKPRDADRLANKNAENSNPKAYAAANILGALPGASIGGGIKSLGQAALQGTTLGALLGLNSSEADLTKGEFSQSREDSEKGALAGGIAGPLGYGAAKGVGMVADKSADAVKGLASLFGHEATPNAMRAAQTLAGNAEINAPQIQRVLESEAIDKIPPSTLAGMTTKAPDALARVSANPRVQVAEGAAKMDIRQVLSGLKTQDSSAIFASEKANPETVQLLKEVAAGRMPKGGQNILADLLLKGKRAINPTQMVNDQNLARVLSDPAKTREAAMLLLSLQKPGLAPDAAAAISSRLSAITASE